MDKTKIINNWYIKLKHYNDIKKEFKRLYPGKDIEDFYSWFFKRNGIDVSKMQFTELISNKRRALEYLYKIDFDFKKVKEGDLGL